MGEVLAIAVEVQSAFGDEVREPLLLVQDGHMRTEILEQIQELSALLRSRPAVLVQDSVRDLVQRVLQIGCQALSRRIELEQRLDEPV